MMKKLLILSMVFGMSSLAAAVPTISASDLFPEHGDTIEVYITGTAADASTDGVDNTGGFSAYIVVDYANYGTSGGSPYLTLLNGSLPTATEAAAGGWATATTGGTSSGYFSAAASMPWAEATDVDVGLWFTYEFTVDGLDGDSERIDIVDHGSIVASVTIGIIPEPMTMALLGLGGLLLRKRRR
jgi:hypothetical protein